MYRLLQNLEGRKIVAGTDPPLTKEEKGLELLDNGVGERSRGRDRSVIIAPLSF